MTTHHLYWINEAVKLAQQNVLYQAGGPFGCIIVKDNQIIGTGTNKVTSLNDPTAHAEILAIRDACSKLQSFQLHNCEIYTSCEPCPMCLGAIYWARPKAIYYAASQSDAQEAGFDDSFIYKEIDLPMHQRSLIMTCLPIDIKKLPFETWTNQVSRIEY